jgi:hypothetical protein
MGAAASSGRIHASRGDVPSAEKHKMRFAQAAKLRYEEQRVASKSRRQSGTPASKLHCQQRITASLDSLSGEWFENAHFRKCVRFEPDPTGYIR